jgi:hypothetical protein
MLTYFYLSRVSSDPGRFTGQPGCQKGGKWQDLLLLLGVAMRSRLEPPLVQEGEDDSKNGDKDGEDENEGRKKKIVHTVPKIRFMHSQK